MKISYMTASCALLLAGSSSLFAEDKPAPVPAAAGTSIAKEQIIGWWRLDCAATAELLQKKLPAGEPSTTEEKNLKAEITNLTSGTSAYAYSLLRLSETEWEACVGPHGQIKPFSISKIEGDIITGKRKTTEVHLTLTAGKLHIRSGTGKDESIQIWAKISDDEAKKVKADFDEVKKQQKAKRQAK